MNTLPFIPKENQDCPDSYGMTILFVNGKKEEVEIARHSIVNTVRVYCVNGDFSDEAGNRYRLEAAPSPFLEYVTKDDLWLVIPMSSIQRIEFDKQWSKIVASKEKKRG